jgi:hypothetical protein
MHLTLACAVRTVVLWLVAGVGLLAILIGLGAWAV